MTKQLSVSAIENGTVIDHIPAGFALKIVDFLKLSSHKKRVTLGLNLPSKSLGYKDLVKVEGRSLTEDEANKIAILAPGATIAIIEEFQVVKKFKVQMPKSVEKIFHCQNPQCITNHESVLPLFDVKAVSKKVELKCKYCEKHFSHDSY